MTFSIRSILYALSLTFFLLQVTACKEDTTVTISGTISDAKNLTANIDLFSMKKGVVNSLISFPIDEQGSFSHQFAEGISPGLYKFRVGTRGTDLLINGTEKNIVINGTLQELLTASHTIEGAPLSSDFQVKIKGLMNKSISLEDYKSYASSDIDPLLASALLLRLPVDPGEFQKFADISDKMGKLYPEAPFYTDLDAFSKEMAAQKRRMDNRYKVKLGQPAPDIVMPDTKGDIRKLSDLKGKVVLLDFWASWCGPCRRANPHVVEMYHKYNADGFEVFNVSLDGLDSRSAAKYKSAQIQSEIAKSKLKWKEAIAKDKLVWDNHVSDLKKWESQGAALYGVTSIPTTFLIDRNGNVAALNPKNNLEAEIKKFI